MGKGNFVYRLRQNKSIIIWVIGSLIFTLGFEIIQRRSIQSGITFYINNIDILIINYIIVLALSSISLLFKRQVLYLYIIGFIFSILAIASSMMTKLRGTPLTFADFYSISDGMSIAKDYLDNKMILKMTILIILLFLILPFIWRIKINRNLYINMFFLVGIYILVSLTIPIAENNKILNPNQWDINLSYNENGFIYSFINSCTLFKKDVPKDYSKSKINSLNIRSENLKEVSNLYAPENTNIIVLQLEGFMDPTIIKNLEFDKDPIPNFRKSSKKYTSGQLKVPTLGGGTARSEFEVLTGMSLDYLSPGEIPHNSVLKKGPIESMAYVLNRANYKTTFIHNFQGNFYGRNNVYSNLGFNRFISMEYMYRIEKNNFGWPKDQILLENIKNTIKKDENPDFIYSIAVQTHGDYGYEYEYDKNLSKVRVSGNVDSKYIGQVQDYLDDLVDVDKFVGDLVKYVENLDEPTILMVFSDHLPNLDIITSDDISSFTSEEKYQTPYFICDNLGIKKETLDIEAYQISTYIFDKLKIKKGVVNNFHKNYKYKNNYQKNLELLQYDILHGKKHAFGKEYPYKRSNMKMGLDDIYIYKVDIKNNILEVRGNGFNEFSCIYIDGKMAKTKLIDKTKLIAKVKDSYINEISVKQLGRYNKPLGSSNKYKLKQ